MNTMKKEEIIEKLSFLGEDIRENIDKEPYLSMYIKAQQGNAWFLKENIQYSLKQFLPWLEKKELHDFVAKYEENKKQKNLAIVCAGNIPAVGFHDILCGLLSNCSLQVKLSSNDKTIIPFLINRMSEKTELPVRFVDKIKDFDLVIATGSNNSSLYFESYFKKYPHIIRKSRASIAVIDKKDDDISGIEDDVFMYMGLGCRNVSLLFLPLGFDIEWLKNRFKKYSFLIDFHKYKNNYNYYHAVFQMNNINALDGGFYLLQNSKELHCPISVVNYCFYENKKEVEDFIVEKHDELQCIVVDRFDFSREIKTIPFGKAQSPEIDDYADNIDTISFLKNS